MTNVTGFCQYLQGMSCFWPFFSFKTLYTSISAPQSALTLNDTNIQIYSLGNGVSYPCQSQHQQPPNYYESMGATTTPNGHSSTIINMNNFSTTSPNSNSSMNNNHSSTSSSYNNHKNETRLAPPPSSKINSVAPMSDPGTDTIFENPHVNGTSPANDDKLFVKRSDKGASVIANRQAENGSNIHLLNHNSETMNV